MLEGENIIKNVENIKTSFPNFIEAWFKDKGESCHESKHYYDDGPSGVGKGTLARIFQMSWL